MSLRIDLVEPFFAGSHRAWAEGWATHSGHDIRLHTLPGSAWRWRMRGGAATVAPRLADRAARDGLPDLLVVSDMIDLGDLLGRLRRSHSAVPTALYLHENQLTYPRRPEQPLDSGLAWITWRNLTQADEIWCNSAFHRDELLSALPEFLASVPDHDQLGLLPSVERRMRVLPVGVEIPDAGVRSHPPLVLSSQRWHDDKDVDAVARALVWLAESGAEFRVAMIGDHRGGRAHDIDPLLDRLGDRVVARGLVDRGTYERLLGEADVVVSAARNEFFGVAVVEAIGAGAVPVLPRAVAYPEVVPDRHHASVLYERGELRAALARTLDSLAARRREIDGLAASMRRFAWTTVAPAYDAAASALVADGVGDPK